MPRLKSAQRGKMIVSSLLHTVVSFVKKQSVHHKGQLGNTKDTK